jgi:hypothetical protein
MTSRKTLNTETTNINGTEIIVTTIEKTIDVTETPFVNTYFIMTVNGNRVGSDEMCQFQVDFYTENYKIYS